MPRFGFCGPTYQAQSVNADAQRCVNFVLEKDESGAGRSDWQLYQRPALKQFVTAWNGGLYAAKSGASGAIITTPNGRVFAIRNEDNAGTTMVSFYEVASNGVATWKGSEIGAVDSRPLSWAINNQYIAIVIPIAPGDSRGEVFYIDYTGVFTPTPVSVNSEYISQVVFMDGYFLALVTNSSKVYYTLDVTTWAPADVFEPSVTSDYIRQMIVDHRELWLFGDVDTLVYYNSGDADNPFQPNPSGFIQQGIGASASLSQLDNTLFWIGGDIRGAGIGWRANGYTPQRVTNHAIENEWQGYSSISDAVAFPMQMNGHSFWVVYFPAANKTWIYDVANGNWVEWTHLIPDTGVEEAFRGWVHAYIFGKHLIGDWKTYAVYELNWPASDGSGGWSFVTDELTIGTKDAIRRRRRTPHVADEGQRIYIPELQIFLESGLGPIPPLYTVIPYAAPVLSEVGGNLDVGTWSVAIFERVIGSTELLNFSEVSEITTHAAGAFTGGISVPLPDSTAEKWRVYVSNDGFTTAFYQDVNVGMASITVNVLTSPWVSGVPDFTPFYRSPQVTLRISKDGGHTYGNEIARDCGSAGEFAARVRFLRLGQARDWVFELAMTDPIPWRITDAVIRPDYPSSRLAGNLRKQA